MIDLKKESRYLLVFGALVCFYFYDVFLNGALLAVEDGIAYHYPMMITMTKQIKSLHFPFWNPLEYSGFPLFAALEPGAFYPPNVILPLLAKPPLAYNLNLMLHYALAGFFVFLYARQIGLNAVAALVAGTVFSLLGYLPAHLFHVSVIAAGIWIPLLLFCYERLKQSLQLKEALYAAVIIALQVFAGHPQICLYTYLLILLYAAFSVVHLNPANRVRYILLCILSLAAGLLLALPQIVATAELAALGMRTETSYEFFSSYPFPPHMIPTFLFPFFYYHGGSYSGEMWGPVPAIGQEAFVGTLPFLLSLLVALRWKKNPHILFWAVVAVLAFVMALGDFIRPLNKILFHLPGYNAFRGHSKLMLVVSLALSILAGFGMSFLQKREQEKRFLATLAAVLGAVIMITLVAATFFHGDVKGFFTDTFSEMEHFQLRWDRTEIPEKALSIHDASLYIPIIIMSVYLCCILSYFVAKKRTIQVLCFCGIFSILLAEALSWKLIDMPRKEDVENYNKELYSILAPRRDGRTVFLSNNAAPLTAMPYGIHLSDGYESLETEDYAKILPRMYLQPPRAWRLLLENNALLSMMNTRYLVVSPVVSGIDDVRRYVVRDGNGRPLPVPYERSRPESVEFIPVYRKVADFDTGALYENILALPRAYPVLKLKAVNSVDDMRRSLFSFKIDPWYEAGVSAEDLQEIGSQDFSPGVVTIGEDGPGKVAVTTKFSGTGFVVLADQFYPRWEAYLDGRRSKIYKTNGVLRGVVVPGGEHEIVFTYVPRHIYVSMALSGSLLAAIVYILLKKPAVKAPHENKQPQ